MSRIFLLICLTLSFSPIHADIKNTSQTMATHHMLVINNEVLATYDKAHAQYENQLLHSFPVIVARFSADGGRLTLYRPGKTPLIEKPVPDIYSYSKSVGHSVMISETLSKFYLNRSTTDKSWQPIFKTFQSKTVMALKSINQLDISTKDKKTFQDVLELVNAYLSDCITHNQIDKSTLSQYTKKIKPYIPLIIQIAADAQIKHHMSVLNDWKKLLGKNWGETYAMTNTIYVTRQNNLLYSMLAEFMGSDAINHRLFLFETTSFTTTNEDLLHLWSRIMFDRELSMTLFNNKYLMDSELLANGGRQIIIEEAKKYNLPDILPQEVPFNSTEWPWRDNPHSGTGPCNLSQLLLKDASLL